MEMAANFMAKRKKALVACTVACFLDFELNDIKILLALGYEVHIATNFDGYADRHMDEKLEKIGVPKVCQHEVKFARSPINKDNLNAYKELSRIVFQQHFSVIHCHTPVGGVLSRLVAKKYNGAVSRHNKRIEKRELVLKGRSLRCVENVKVIYTAHGFHFYKGAPLKNWLLYYPVEKFLSRYTDVLITINKEDYTRAKKEFHAKKTVYIPGVGVDTARFSPGSQMMDREQKRAELEISIDDFLMISVGELSVRKNQIVVLKALDEINVSYPEIATRLKYVIVGQGSLEEEYRDYIKKHHLEGMVKLLGYRADIPEILRASDLFVFPSLQEGLPVALMEAMASGVPVVCSKIRGNVDLIEDERYLFDPTDITGLEVCLKNILSKDASVLMEIGVKNSNKICSYNIDTVEKLMNRIYGSVSVCGGGDLNSTERPFLEQE